MEMFNIDEEMILNTIAESLEIAGAQTSEEQFNNIANAINEELPGVIEILAYGMMAHWKKEANI